jgi:hypothetical protein
MKFMEVLWLSCTFGLNLFGIRNKLTMSLG